MALDTTGLAAATPTGAVWVAIPAGRKAYKDISAATDAASVAALAETALDALVGLSAVITTDDSANDGTMLLTYTGFAEITNPTPHSFDDGGAGSILGAETSANVVSEVNLTANTVSIPTHGWYTGTMGQLTTTGTLPTGVTTGTDYFLIKVDANTVKFATTYAHALAGTAIDLTGEGAGVHTFTANATLTGTVKVQCSVDNSTWFDITDQSEAISGAGSNLFVNQNSDAGYGFIRLAWVMSTGFGVMSAKGNSK